MPLDEALETVDAIRHVHLSTPAPISAPGMLGIDELHESLRIGLPRAADGVLEVEAIRSCLRAALRKTR